MAITLKLNGRPFDLHPARPTEAKIKALLDKAPADEILTTADLSCRLNSSRLTLRRNSAEYGAGLPAYTATVGHNRYWGNPKAIAELLRQVKHEGE